MRLISLVLISMFISTVAFAEVWTQRRSSAYGGTVVQSSNGDTYRFGSTPGGGSYASGSNGYFGHSANNQNAWVDNS